MRLLLVHHSASPNGYAAGDVPRVLESFRRYHTGTKGWPDVAYNLFVDAYGGCWEGRAGSLEGPVQADATGGSAGSAQLVCLVGDHTSAPVPAAARETLVRVLAWLAVRDGVSTAPGAVASFVSRGSNRFPAGAPVRTPTLSGHRDLSLTTCPGDAAYALVRGDLPDEVHAAATVLLVTPRRRRRVIRAG